MLRYLGNLPIYFKTLKDMNKLIIVFLCVFFGSNTIAQKTKYNLMFDQGQVALSEKQKEEIKKILTWIKPKEVVSIFPLTYDTNFDRLFFPRNAKSQADQVMLYAKSIGFEPEGTPRNFPSTYKGLSVCVNVSYNVPKPKNLLSEIFPEKPSQYFIIDPKKDTFIIGNEGTKLLFEAGSLISSKKVKVELKEFYGVGDLIKNGLPTSSNGNLIETGGSIYLNATAHDNEKAQVKINANKGVTVDFTIGKSDPEMEIFVKDPRYPNQMNWVLPRNKSSITESWQMTETILNAEKSIQSEKVFNSKEEWEAYLKMKKEAEAQKQKNDEAKRLIQKKNNEVKRLAQNKMNSKLKLYNFGYINCDKFINEPMIPFFVESDQNTIAEYYLVFNDVRGVMMGKVYNQQVNFGSVPKNKEATLIALSYIDKQAYLYRSTITTGSSTVSNIILKPVEESFLNEQLALLK